MWCSYTRDKCSCLRSMQIRTRDFGGPCCSNLICCTIYLGWRRCHRTLPLSCTRSCCVCSTLGRPPPSWAQNRRRHYISSNNWSKYRRRREWQHCPFRETRPGLARPLDLQNLVAYCIFQYSRPLDMPFGQLRRGHTASTCLFAPCIAWTFWHRSCPDRIHQSTSPWNLCQSACDSP